MRFSNRDSKFIRALYKKTNGYIKIKCGHNIPGRMISTSAVTGKYLENCFHNTYFDGINQKMTLCTYIKKGHANEANINTVCALAINIKFNDFVGKPIYENNEYIFSEVYSEVLDCIYSHTGTEKAFPTAFICGHDIQMIYLMESPICLRIKDKTKKDKTKLWLEKITEQIAEWINNDIANITATPEKINGWIRVPGSVEAYYKLDEAIYSKSKGEERRYRKVYANGITILSEKDFTNIGIHELSDIILKQKNKKKKLVYVSLKQESGIKNLLKKRKAFLEELQKLYLGTEAQIKMNYLYRNCCLKEGMNQEEAQKAILAFNKNFFMPLDEADLLKKIGKSEKTYRFTDKAFFDAIGINEEIAIQYGYQKSDTKTYDKFYSKLYRAMKYKDAIVMEKTKMQQKTKMAIRIQTLAGKGKSIFSIAKEFAISVSTVYRYLKMKVTLELMSKQKEKMLLDVFAKLYVLREQASIALHNEYGLSGCLMNIFINNYYSEKLCVNVV